MRFTIDKKIGICFGVLIVVMVAMGVTCFSLMQDVKIKIVASRTASERSEMASAAALNIRNVMVGIRGAIAFGQDSTYRQTESELAKAEEIQTQLLNMAPEEKNKDVKNLIAATAMWKEGILNDSLPNVRKYHAAKAVGDFAAMKSIQAELDRIAGVLTPHALAITKSMDAIKAYEDEQRQSTAASAIAAANRVTIMVNIINAAGILLSILFGILVTRKIRIPVTLMLNETRKFADGDWRRQIPVTTNDEIGELANSLNKMRDNTQELIRQITASVEQVVKASEQLNTSAEQSAQGASLVAESISSVAAGATLQLKTAHESIQSVAQITANIQTIVENTSMVSKVAESASNTSRAGKESMERVKIQMLKIERTVGGSSQIVSKLGERSREIGQIVDTISEIAGQTNLLALNAAIEAARAGEQGRGFAVVAEEVRKLAEQSHTAAKQIACLISEIQNDTATAVASMKAGNDEVLQGTQVVTEAGIVFTEIINLISQVNNQMSCVSTAIQQLASSSQQIIYGVRDIEKVSKKTAEQSQTVSAATQQQAASMQEISASSHAMSVLAEKLEKKVALFKV